MVNISATLHEKCDWLIQPRMLDIYNMILKEKDIEVVIYDNVARILANLAADYPENRDIIIKHPVFEQIYILSDKLNDKKSEETLCFTFMTFLRGKSENTFPPIEAGKLLVNKLMNYFINYHSSEMAYAAAIGIIYFLQPEYDASERALFVANSGLMPIIKERINSFSISVKVALPMIRILTLMASVDTPEIAAIFNDKKTIDSLMAYFKLKVYESIKSIIMQLLTRLVEMNPSIRDMIVRQSPFIHGCLDVLMQTSTENRAVALCLLHAYFMNEEPTQCEKTLVRNPDVK